MKRVLEKLQKAQRREKTVTLCTPAPSVVNLAITPAHPKKLQPTMKIRERTHGEINEMGLDELGLLHGGTRLITKIRQRRMSELEERPAPLIEEILKMASSSKTNWSECVYLEREERG